MAKRHKQRQKRGKEWKREGRKGEKVSGTYMRGRGAALRKMLDHIMIDGVLSGQERRQARIMRIALGGRR